jgi:DNA primase
MQIPRLHPDTVEVIKERADIVDVISEHVVLRKRGKDFIGLCPFHNEKSPSFSVSPSKQMYFCFGCRSGGNVFTFLTTVQKRSFSEVALDLAQRYQVHVKTLEPEQRQELQRQMSLRDQLYEVLASAANFYQHALKQPQGKIALDYLQQKRRFSDEVIQQFGLGFAPPGWETLYRYLVETKGYPVQLLEKAGLIKSRKEGNGYYDVFRDRLMIPIHDAMGRVIAFGGRTLGDDQPKYLNSPETEVFFKGKTLFALDKARNGISREDKAIVVEGYFDAIALHAVGITNVVASLGTALSMEQVRLVLRYSDSKQIILNFDADKAGVNAAERAIGEIADLAYKGEVQLKILNIPDGKDADEYLYTHDSSDYQELVNNAPLWLDWQIKQIIHDKDLKQATDYQQVSQGIVKLLKNIVNKDTLDYYVSYCAEMLTLGDTRLIPLRIENLLTQIGPSATSPKSFPVRVNREQATQYTQEQSTTESQEFKIPKQAGNLLQHAEALLLRIYLHYHRYREMIVNALEERDLQFSLSHHRFLWQQIIENPSPTEKDLISSLQDRYLEFPEEMSLIAHLLHLTEKAQQEMIFYQEKLILAAVAAMERVNCEKLSRYFLELYEKADEKGEVQESQSYYQAFYKYKLRLWELDRQRHFSITDLF